MRPPPKADAVQTGHHEPAIDDEDEGQEAGTSRALDPELAAMRAILRTLPPLDEPARARVVRWLGDRFAAEL